MIFLAFCGLSFCGRKTGLSGRIFIVALSKVSTTVASHTRLRPLYQGPKVRPSGLLPSLVRPTGSKVEGRGETNVGQWPLEDGVDGWIWLGKRPAFLVQERPWCLSSSTTLPQRHLELSKILAPVWRAIAIRSSSGLSKFPTLAMGNASDQAAVWLSCAASNWQ